MKQVGFKEIINQYYTLNEVKSLIDKKYPDIEVNVQEYRRVFFRHYPEVVLLYEGNTYYLKRAIDKIEFNLQEDLKKVSSSRTVKATVDASLGNGFLVLPTAHMLGIAQQTLLKLLKEEKVIRYSNKDKKLVNRDDINKWLKFKENYVAIDDIYEEAKEEFPKGYNITETFLYKKFRKILKDNLFDKYGYVDAASTCFIGKYGFIKSEFENIVKEELIYIMSREITYAYGTQIQIFEFEVNNIHNKNIIKTLEYLSKFAIDRLSRNKSIYAVRYQHIFNALSKLDKELFNCNDEEITKILSGISVKKSKQEFCLFITYLQKVLRTNLKAKYNYDRELVVKKREDNKPYTTEQYLRFGFLVLSDEHIWYESFLEKAISNRKYSSTWLYAVLHYTIAWRGKDIRVNLPRPTLPVSATEIIELIKSKSLPQIYAFDAVEEVNNTIKMLNIKPDKTDSRTAPNLVLEVPESIKELLGMLLLLAEAHYQLTSNYQKVGLLSNDCIKKSVQMEFFGEEFKDIFNGESFLNSRAVKNYEMLTLKNGDEMQLGSGYILASIARSHKMKNSKLAETTKIYLKYYNQLEDSERLLRELFERGVCSFLPYLLTKAVVGKEKLLDISIESKKKLIDETIGINNYDVELMIQLFDKVTERTFKQVNEIISEYNLDSDYGKKSLRKTIENIAHNVAPSKQENLGCIAIAQGKGCIYPLRKVCVGCGQEIYLKAFISELGRYINNCRDAAHNSTTKGSKSKNIMMIKNVLVPIVEDILVTLKQVYNIQDLKIYKELTR